MDSREASGVLQRWLDGCSREQQDPDDPMRPLRRTLFRLLEPKDPGANELLHAIAVKRWERERQGAD